MKTEGIDYVTTTLTASPYQKHDMVREAGEQAGKELFLYRDFRPLYYKGKNTAYHKGYYLQKYCGCLQSQAQRHIGTKAQSNGIKSI
jgi:hypothetical protein